MPKNPKPVSVVIANENKSKKDTIDLESFYIVKVSTEIKKVICINFIIIWYYSGIIQILHECII